MDWNLLFARANPVKSLCMSILFSPRDGNEIQRNFQCSFLMCQRIKIWVFGKCWLFFTCCQSSFWMYYVQDSSLWKNHQSSIKISVWWQGIKCIKIRFYDTLPSVPRSSKQTLAFKILDQQWLILTSCVLVTVVNSTVAYQCCWPIAHAAYKQWWRAIRITAEFPLKWLT